MNGLTASRVLTLDMSTTKNITWVAAYGYHGYYEVSDFGDVRNIAKRKGSSVGRVLKKRVTKEWLCGLMCGS